MSDATIESVEEGVAAAWQTNAKAMFDTWLSQFAAEEAERRVLGGERSQLTQLAVRQAEADHQIVLQMAQNGMQAAQMATQNGLSLSHLISTNGANFSSAMQSAQVRAFGNQGTIDNVVLMDGVTNLKAAQIARDSMMSDVAMDLKTTAGAAIDASEAAQSAATSAQAAASGFGVVSSPVPQGTTGVAQAGLQTGYGVAIESLMASNATATNAILASIAELNKAISFLIVKVSGDVAVAKQ